MKSRQELISEQLALDSALTFIQTGSFPKGYLDDAENS